MKHLIFAVIAATLLTSCSKETFTTPPPHVKAVYQVFTLGKVAGDTSFSSVMFARAETVGLVIAEDSKLKAELISYNGAGIYTVRVTSKIACQGIVRWGWDGLTIDSISPTSDVIPTNGVVTFTLHGDHHVGKIKLKLESDCGNSSTLIINITNEILPINFIANTAKYDEKTGKTTIVFTIDDPTQVEWVAIRKQDASLIWRQVMLISCDKVTKLYNIKL